jgi:hypothetical protein
VILRRCASAPEDYDFLKNGIYRFPTLVWLLPVTSIPLRREIEPVGTWSVEWRKWIGTLIAYFHESDPWEALAICSVQLLATYPMRV